MKNETKQFSEKGEMPDRADWQAGNVDIGRDNGHAPPQKNNGYAGQGVWGLLRIPFQSRATTPDDGLDVAPAQVGRTKKQRKKKRKSRYASWEFEPGTPIAKGREVLKCLGGGSRYEVYLVWDNRLFALTVAKILRPDRVDDPRTRRELRLEAEVIAKLAHPILVRGFGAVLAGPYPHVLIEYIEGDSLGRLLKRYGPLPLEQLLPLALHIAAVLQYMTTESIVHLDVKPDNIVMGIPSRLIDLSLARSFASAARIRGLIGTDAYMPPEQCDPNSFPGTIGPPADMWGLGATLYHAATGKRPFPRPRGAHKSTDLNVRFPQLFEDPTPLPKHIPILLGELILRLLSKNPAERPVAHEVAPWLEPLVAALPTRLRFSRFGFRSR